MTSSLFQEALADAKQLREVAEQNAKNAIIEAVTPKIRKFIEDQLLEGAHAKVTDLDEDSAADEIDLTVDGGDSVDKAGSTEDLAERVQLMRAMARVVEGLSPEESASLLPVVEKMRGASKPGSAGIRRAVPSDVRSTHIVKENAAMQGKNKMYEVDLDELMSDEIATGDEGMEYEGMHHGHAEDEGTEDAMMEDEMSDLYESLSALFEADDEEGDTPVEPTGDEEEGEELADDEGDAGGLEASEEGATGVHAEIADVKNELDDIKGMLEQILSSMSAEAAPSAPEMPMPDEMGAPPAPPAGGEMPPGAAPSPSERVYRVNESALMRELAALREGKSALGTGNKPAKKVAGALPEAVAEDEDMGMGLDELADEFEGDPTAEGKNGGKMPAHTKGNGPGKSAPFSETAKVKVMKENRDLKVSLAKHAEAVESLRGQLTEMNLFNAKLLYVNRLLQDRDLSDAQRRNIIESLDRAQSLREVKLLYKGLTESIGRSRSGKSKPEVVSESVNRGFSPTARPLSTSGVRMNEAVEVHRWAVLAGINSKA